MPFPIDKRLAEVLWFPAPDVVPELCAAISDTPMEVWNSTEDLYELADVIEPYLKKHGGRKWDFVWSMERHFSEPYGPLPKAKQTFMAGIPDEFLQDVGGLPENAGSYEVGGVSDVRFVRTNDIEVEAKPYQYEAGDEMPEEFRFWLSKLFFKHGECMMPYFGDAAKGHKSMFSAIDSFSMEAAPDAASRLRQQNFSAEEYKHTFQFYKLYSEYDPEIPIQIYERERETFRAYEQTAMEATWVDRGLYNMLADRFGVYQGFQWVQSSYAPLARVSLLVCKDERGHSNMGYIHVRDSIDRWGEDARKEAQRRVNEYWYPQFMASFGSDDSRNSVMWCKWGLKELTNGQMRDAFHLEMTEVLDSLNLETPDKDQALGKGMEMAEAVKKKMAGLNAKKSA
jgi:1,2-phenylacetyl-CoA epoxidase catalytic subunit